MKLPADISYLVGVDGGGSSTRARITLPDGTLLGEGKAGASGLMQGIAQAWQHIQLAIARAAHNINQPGLPVPDKNNCALGIGVAGFNNAQWRSVFLAANPGADAVPKTAQVSMLSNRRIDDLFEATVFATEEAVINAMVAAETMIGRDNHQTIALPHEELKQALRKYGRLAEAR